MTKDEMIGALDGIVEDLHAQFPRHQRLQQLDDHTATVKMVVEHIFDEDARDKARIAAAVEAARVEAGGQ